MSVQRLVPLNLGAFASDPGTAIAGDIYWNTTTPGLRVYNGTVWAATGAAGATGASGSLGIITVLCTDPNGSALTVVTSLAYFRIPSQLNGLSLVEVAAAVSTVSSSGLPTATLRRVRSGSAVTMLSTAITIDASEWDSSTAATPAVINGTNAGVLTGDQIHIDCSVAGTGAKGLEVQMRFA